MPTSHIDDIMPIGKVANDPRFISEIERRRRKPVFKSELIEGEFPQLIVTVPDTWPSVKLAPLFDVHCGHGRHDRELFARHKAWIIRTPNVLTFNGGDYVENSSKLSVGAGVYEQDYDPQNQFARAALDFVDMSAKMMFSIPGNHEGRCAVMGVDVAQWAAWLGGCRYFHGYVFLTIRFKGNNFRGVIHHGAGGAQTAGGQVMAARKDLHWANADFYWCFPAGTPILMADGVCVPIEDVKAGDSIISGNGKVAKVRGLDIQEYSGQLVGMRPWGWPETIYATPNHPMLAQRRYGLKDYGLDFFRADALVYKDALKRVELDGLAIPDVDSDRMRLYGYFLAEGCAWESDVNSSKQLTFSFAEDEEKTLVADCARLLKRMGYKPSFIRQPKCHSIGLRVCGAEPVAHFKTLFGHYSHTKKIPQEFLRYPSKHIQELLRGLFLGDGYTRRQGKHLDTTSRALAEQAILLLSRLGEPASLGIRNRLGKRTSYGVFTNHKEGAQLFRKFVRVGNGWASPLRSISRKDFEGKIYNLSIEGDDPTFVVGQFIVHNTGHLHTGRVELAYRQDNDQASGRVFERDAFVIISPSYLSYFGTYAESKRYPPGTRGLTVLELHSDGRMDISLHARGARP